MECSRGFVSLAASYQQGSDAVVSHYVTFFFLHVCLILFKEEVKINISCDSMRHAQVFETKELAS
jgi:hypothetical protein